MKIDVEMLVIRTVPADLPQPELFAAACARDGLGSLRGITFSGKEGTMYRKDIEKRGYEYMKSLHGMHAYRASPGHGGLMPTLGKHHTSVLKGMSFD